MSYQKILLQAWQATWRNKYLWFFGLFAVLLGNNGGLSFFYELSNSGSGNDFASGFMRYYTTGVFSFRALGNLGRLIISDPLSFIILLSVFLIFAVLGLFLLWLSVVSQTALVNNSALIVSGKSHSFKKGLEDGINKFWPIFGLNVILKVASVLIVLFTAAILATAIYHLGSFWVSLLFLILFILFIPLTIAISFVVKYAICYVVIKGQTLLEALKSAWGLFKENLVISLEMGIILLFVNFLFGLAMVLFFLIVSIPLLFIIFVLAKLEFMFIFWMIMITAIVSVFFFIIFAGSVLSTFQTAAWTSLFMQMIGKGMKSRIMQLFGRK